MKKHFLIFLLSVAFPWNVHPQILLEKFIHRQDSLREFYSGPYSDTVIQGIKLKVISAYDIDESGMPFYYYGRIEIKDRKVVGEQQPVQLEPEDKTPSYRFHYRSDGTLQSEGNYASDLPIIGRTDYYRDGNISRISKLILGKDKKKNQLIILSKENTIYDHRGNKIITEYLINDNLIKVVPYTINSSGDVRFFNDDKELCINDTINVEDFRNIILCPDSNQNSILKQGYIIRIKVWQKKWQSDFIDFENLRSLNDSVFVARLKKKKIKFNSEIQISFTIYELQGNEVIENHFLVFKMKKGRSEAFRKIVSG